MRSSNSTQKIMLDVIIALIPSIAFGVYNFGFYAFLIIVVSVAASMAAECLCCLIFKRRLSIGDLSAVVTGIIMGLIMPPSVPLWLPAAGSAFATIFVKQLFGGIGKNRLNPAAVSKTIMMFVFTGYMSGFIYESMTSSAPLVVAEGGGHIDILQMLLGNTAGNIGETSALAIIAGGLYLLIRRVINWRIPVFIILTTAAYMGVYSAVARGGVDVEYVTAHILGGGLLFAAFFMATDYATSPSTSAGRIIYAVIIGAAICTFRICIDSIGANVYGIVIGNVCAIFIEAATIPVYFGKGSRQYNKMKEDKKAGEQAEIARERKKFEALKQQIIQSQKELAESRKNNADTENHQMNFEDVIRSYDEHNA